MVIPSVGRERDEEDHGNRATPSSWRSLAEELRALTLLVDREQTRETRSVRFGYREARSETMAPRGVEVGVGWGGRAVSLPLLPGATGTDCFFATETRKQFQLFFSPEVSAGDNLETATGSWKLV